MGLLIACDLAVGVGGSHKGDGVEAGGVEGYHGNDQKHKDKWRKRQCLDDGDDRWVEIISGGVDRHHVKFSAHLESEAVVS